VEGHPEMDEDIVRMLKINKNKDYEKDNKRTK
jgi:hypothetical protein